MLNAMEFRPKISEEDEDNENFAGQLKLDPLPTEFANRKVRELTSTKGMEWSEEGREGRWVRFGGAY